MGHSINAPTGRWQKNKDVHWYNRDLKDSELQRLEEIRKVKEAEADALAVALCVTMLRFLSLFLLTFSNRGYTPEPRGAKAESSGDASEAKTSPEDPQRVIEKEERRRRKEEKRAKKELKREMKGLKKDGKGKRGEREHHYDRDDPRDPRRKLQRTRDSHSRSRSPHTRRRPRSSTPPPRDLRDYDDEQREKERQRDRHRWDQNSRRNAPSRTADGPRWARGQDPEQA